MTSPRLPLVKAQRSFLSGIRLSTQLHGHKVKVTAPPMKKTEVLNSQGFSFEIEEVETCIEDYEKKLEKIEKCLRLEELPDQRRLELQEEQKRIKKDITLQDATLKQLRKENWKNMFLSLLIILLLYLVYHSIWAP